MSMDHLLSAGYLVESGVSSTSFSTHLLTFSNQQSEQVGFSCKNLIETFSPIHSGGRGADIYLKSEVSIPKKKGSFVRVFSLHRYSCKFCDYKTDKKSNHDSHTKFVHFKARDPCPECGKQIANLSQHLRVSHKIFKSSKTEQKCPM